MYSLYIEKLSRSLILQCWRRRLDMCKALQVGNFAAGLSSKRVALEKTRIIDGNKYYPLQKWLLEWSKKLEDKGFIPEVHLTAAWFKAGPMAVDLLIDIERRPLKQAVEDASNIVRYLEMYGLKPTVKLSGIGDYKVGFHVYVDLSITWQLDLTSRWKEFYEKLIRHLCKIYNINNIDPAFKSIQHMYRSFLSPRSEKEDPRKFCCYTIPVNLEELKDLINALGEKTAYEALQIEATTEPSYRVPWSGIKDLDSFLALFEGVTSYRPQEEKIRETRKGVLAYRYRLYRSNRRYKWIEKILANGLPDGRKRFIYRCAAPYLASKIGKEMDREQALAILASFVKKSMEKGANGKITNPMLRSWINWALEKKIKPMSMSRFLEEYPDLQEVVKPIILVR